MSCTPPFVFLQQLFKCQHTGPIPVQLSSNSLLLQVATQFFLCHHQLLLLHNSPSVIINYYCNMILPLSSTTSSLFALLSSLLPSSSRINSKSCCWLHINFDDFKASVSLLSSFNPIQEQYHMHLKSLYPHPNTCNQICLKK